MIRKNQQKIVTYENMMISVKIQKATWNQHLDILHICFDQKIINMYLNIHALLMYMYIANSYIIL